MWAGPRCGDKRWWSASAHASHRPKGGTGGYEECREKGKGRCCFDRQHGSWELGVGQVEFRASASTTATVL